MIATLRLAFIIILFPALFMLSGCSSIKTAVLPEHRLITMIQAGRSLNPDETGRPSPLSVYFYQLKDHETFDAAEFFPLYDNPKETLGADYLAVSKIELTPSTKARLTVNLKEGVQYIGVVAAYHNLQKVTWRKIIPVDFSWGRKKIRLRFTRYGIESV